MPKKKDKVKVEDIRAEECLPDRIPVAGPIQRR